MRVSWAPSDCPRHARDGPPPTERVPIFPRGGRLTAGLSSSFGRRRPQPIRTCQTNVRTWQSTPALECATCASYVGPKGSCTIFRHISCIGRLRTGRSSLSPRRPRAAALGVAAAVACSSRPTRAGRHPPPARSPALVEVSPAASASPLTAAAGCRRWLLWGHLRRRCRRRCHCRSTGAPPRSPPSAPPPRRRRPRRRR